MTRARIILAIALQVSALVSLIVHWLGRGEFGAGISWLIVLWLAAELVRPGVDAIDRTIARRDG